MEKEKIIELLKSKVEKLENGGNSQNICGECYKEGQIDTYKECIKLLSNN